MGLFERSGKSRFSATYAISFNVENEGCLCFFLFEILCFHNCLLRCHILLLLLCVFSFVHLVLLLRHFPSLVLFVLAVGPDNINRCALVTSFDKNSLYLDARDIETLFHEWGHFLASLLSKTTYQQFAGNTK